MRFLVTNLKECFSTVLPTYPLKKKEKFPLLLTPDRNLHCAPPCIVPQVTLCMCVAIPIFRAANPTDLSVDLRIFSHFRNPTVFSTDF